MARRDLSGAVDFSVLERVAGGDAAVMEEILDLFREQAAVWSGLLNPNGEAWRDACHTIKGAAAGVGAGHLAQACGAAEAADGPMAAVMLDRVRDALDLALADVAAYQHELLLRSLRS